MINYPVNNIYNPYTPYNTLTQPYNSVQSQQQGLIRVSGIEGAKAYQMQPNSVVALFDNNDDIFYLKISDGAGFSTIRRFSFSEVFDTVQTPQITASQDYVTRTEFEKLKEIVENGKHTISAGKRTDKTANVTE